MVIEASIYSAMAFLVSWKATLMALGAGGFHYDRFAASDQKKTAAPVLNRPNTCQSLIAQMTDILTSIKPLKAMAREQQSTPC